MPDWPNKVPDWSREVPDESGKVPDRTSMVPDQSWEVPDLNTVILLSVDQTKLFLINIENTTKLIFCE